MSTENDKQKEETLPVLRAPRLPYHPAIQDRFGMDKSDWIALIDVIFPLAQTTESCILALAYCKARKLDVFKRVVHIVPIWDKNKKRLVDTIWPGIGELRTTAHRTGCYAGREKTEFGPMIKKTWGNVTVDFPEWAQVIVYRVVHKRRVAYAGPQVYWLETFANTKDGAPNSMWQRRPRGQLDKCAEAAALRSAFPEEVGNDYIDSEAHIAGQQFQTYEEAQAKSDERINKEAGSKPIDVNFENDKPPGARPEPNDKPDEKTQKKIDKEKAKLAKTPKPDPAIVNTETGEVKDQFRCNGKCKETFAEPGQKKGQINGSPIYCCPNCGSLRIEAIESSTA